MAKLRSLLLGALGANALDVTFNPGGANAVYKVSHGGKTLFSSEDGLATFVEGAWQTPKSGLQMTGHSSVSGTDDGLGKYTGTEIKWLAGKETVLVTTAKTYATGLDIAFEYSFPKGAKGTSQVRKKTFEYCCCLIFSSSNGVTNVSILRVDR